MKTKRVIIYIGAFVVLAIITAAYVFPDSKLGHIIGNVFQDGELGNIIKVMIYAFLITIAVLVLAILSFISMRLYKNRIPETKIVEGEPQKVVKEKLETVVSTPPFFSPLLTGLIWPGLPVLAGLGLVAYAISPSLVQVPNMLMVPIGAIALYYALRSAAWRSKITTSEGKEEFNSGLVGTRSVVGKITLVILLITGYYGYNAPPGTFTDAMKGGPLSGLGKVYVDRQAEQKRVLPSVATEDLPQNILLDPVLLTSEVNDWIVNMNIRNSHITIGDIKFTDRLTITEGSYVTDHVSFSVVSSEGYEVKLFHGKDSNGKPIANCKNPTKDDTRVYIPKTCAGNWIALDYEGKPIIGGVYALVFKNPSFFTVDLYRNEVVTGMPDAKLFVEHSKKK